MGRKSYHEHLTEEKEQASQALNKAKSLEGTKGTIYLDDKAHTIILVKRSNLKLKVAQLESEGKKIKQVL